MANKYLEKIAEMSTENKVDSAAKGLLGVGIASGASQRMLGYHTVYHGTSRENAKKIREQGFDPARGGKEGGASAVHHNEKLKEAFTRRSAGKVHVSKMPHVAAFFGGFHTARSGKMPGMVKARVSDRMWSTFKADKDMGSHKPTAATTTHKIDSKFVAGGKGSMGPAAFLNKKHLGRYYSTSAGKSRAAVGLGMLIGGAGIAANNFHKLVTEKE